MRKKTLSHTIELTAGAKRALASISERDGVIEFTMFSRLVTWFVEQDYAVQSQVLTSIALMPEHQHQRMILERIVEVSHARDARKSARH